MPAINKVNFLYRIGAYLLLGSGVLIGGNRYVEYKEDRVRAEVAAKEQDIRKEVADKECQYREEAEQKEQEIRRELKKKEAEIRDILDTSLRIYQKDQRRFEELTGRVETLEKELKELKALQGLQQEVKLNGVKQDKDK